MILSAILRVLLRIKTRDRIPKLPRGMLASEYTSISRDDARVLARLGARSPSGVRIALQRAGVSNIRELAQQLRHYRPQRHIRQRWSRMLDRAFRASSKPLHLEDVREDARHARKRRANEEVAQRLKAYIQEVSD